MDDTEVSMGGKMIQLPPWLTEFCQARVLLRVVK